MTAVLCILAVSMCPPPAHHNDARGGVAHPIQRGGEAAPLVVARELATFNAFVCIHQHEAAWNDRGDPYWGGLQMDRSFMHTYGRDMEQRHHGGLADTWTPAEQIIVADRAHRTRGYGPWPNTRIPCGV